VFSFSSPIDVIASALQTNIHDGNVKLISERVAGYQALEFISYYHSCTTEYGCVWSAGDETYSIQTHRGMSFEVHPSAASCRRR